MATLISMIISIFCVWLFFGDLFFAFAIVIGTLIHEMGHYVSFISNGYKASLPIFIGPIGAYVKSPGSRISARTYASISYAGPFAGGALASLLVFFILYKNPNFEFRNQLLIAAAFNSANNLLNLIPIKPLDGGAIAPFISKNFKYLGFILLGIYYIVIPFPLTALIIFFALIMNDLAWWEKIFIGGIITCCIYMRESYLMGGAAFENWGTLEQIAIITVGIATLISLFTNQKGEYSVTRNDKIKWVILYFGLAISLAVISLVFISNIDNLEVVLNQLTGSAD